MHGDNLSRVGIKLFAAEPAPIRMRDFVPVFHTWIQKQCIEGHLLIDVHDYSHIHEGPGILLVAHEGNFSMDMADGRLGLAYYRKHPVGGNLQERLATTLRSALQACSLLEDEPGFKDTLRFQTDQLLVFANDRLLAPNEPKTLSHLQPELSAIFDKLLGGAEFASASKNPKDRFTVRVRGKESPGVKQLLRKS